MTQRVTGGLERAGPVAETINDLYLLLLGLGLAVFLLFMVLFVRALFRSRSAQEPDTPDLTRRWIIGGGVVLPVVVLTGVFGATVYAMRVVPTTAPSNALVVDIVGHQWWFEVTYPDEGISTRSELHLPVGRPVALRLTSADVIHSFWVPELGGKMDMMPGDTNVLVLEAGEPGEYRARCAEFCGLHHAGMQMPVVAEPAERFTAWLAAQR